MSHYSQDPKNPVPCIGQLRCVACRCFYWKQADGMEDPGRCQECMDEVVRQAQAMTTTKESEK